MKNNYNNRGQIEVPLKSGHAVKRHSLSSQNQRDCPLLTGFKHGSRQ